MRSHFLVFQVVRALAHQMQIVIGEQRRKRVGIKEVANDAAILADAPTIDRRRNRQSWRQRKNGLEKAFRRNARRLDRGRLALQKYRGAAGLGQKRAYHEPLGIAFSCDVWAEHAEWIWMLRS